MSFVLVFSLSFFCVKLVSSYFKILNYVINLNFLNYFVSISLFKKKNTVLIIFNYCHCLKISHYFKLLFQDLYFNVTSCDLKIML